MADKALSDAPAEATRRGPPRLLLALLALPLLYLGITAWVRAHVSQQMEAVEGRQLPGFRLRDLQGREWSPEALRGRRVLLNFFRSRCPSCLQEAPGLRQLQRELDPAKVVLLSVMMDRVQGYPAELSDRTLARMNYEHPVLMADEAFVAAFHGVRWSHVTPVTYVVDRKGRIIDHLRGHQSLDRLRAATQ